MIKIVCDGCGTELESRRVELTMQRPPMRGGAGIPEGTSHLCQQCAEIAFRALPCNANRFGRPKGEGKTLR